MVKTKSVYAPFETSEAGRAGIARGNWDRIVEQLWGGRACGQGCSVRTIGEQTTDDVVWGYAEKRGFLYEEPTFGSHHEALSLWRRASVRTA